LAARLLNENEGPGNNGLKPLHKKYVLNGKGDAFSFDSLFKGMTFDYIPIKTGYLYAAHDAIITYELYEYQRPFLTADNKECIRRGLQDVSWVFFNIEMPCVQVVADMEDNGIELDLNYANELSIKYHELLNEKENEFYHIIDTFKVEPIEHYKGEFVAREGRIYKYPEKPTLLKNMIESYKRKNPNHKLSDPISIGSSTQLAILLYDILGIEPPDKKSPRGTGVDILQKIDNPICKAVLDYRTISKLITTYIDKLPNCVNPKDGRIHCKFNQYGADTGRFSSNDPNLQNIPSHNKDIRKMFKAQDGYVLMSSDFSQQEPKCLAALCAKAGDSQMLNTFLAGKDLYSEIASKAFNVPYEDCREFRPDGTTNEQGKARRTQAKSILLGVLYGRGVPSIAEQLHTTTKKAQEIKDSVFKGFPAIKEFEKTSLEMAEDVGFVTTVCGRKRRLPDLQLPEFEFKWKDGYPKDDDLLDFDNEDEEVSTEVPQDMQDYYLRKLSNAYFTQKRRIFEEANTKGIWIVDNGAKIADAQRQCVNARIQGSAADLTKLAMIELNNNSRLKELGFRLLIPVHDEVIAECPEENAKECSQLLASTMSHAAEEILKIPIKCDVAITRCWYGEEIEV
jgi:DNA polymerase I-like protein with 3'-5' exonuclease and polymerase domains